MVPAFPSSRRPPTSLLVFSNHAYKVWFGPGECIGLTADKSAAMRPGVQQARTMCPKRDLELRGIEAGQIGRNQRACDLLDVVR